PADKDSVDAAPDTRRQLGQIMVDEGFLTETQLLDALAEQNRSGTPLGKVLVDLGFVSPGAVANALAEQHGGLLRTEYGTSAGRELAGRARIRTDAAPPMPPSTPAAAAPQSPPPAAPLGAGLRLAQPVAEVPATEAPAPVAPAPAPVAPPPEPAAAEPEPEPASDPEPEPSLPPAAAGNAASTNSRIEELESQLHGVLTERNSLAQSFNELQARLSDAAQAHEAGVAAEVEQRVGALESQLQAAAASREELERAQQHAAERVAELEGRLAEAAESRREHDSQLQTLQTIAAGRDAALEKVTVLEAELNELRTHVSEDATAELQRLAERRDAAEARANSLETDLAQLREQLEAARQSAGQDDALATQVTGLNEALQALTVERDAAVARSAELEPELASLRDRLRDASAPSEGATADVVELRRQLAARERRLAESVGEIAKMNREHRALLQLVERQFQLEDTTTSVPEPKGEAAHVLFVPSVTGYTLVERDGVAPEAGDILEVDGGSFVVRRHGPSPLPGPRRRCAYLERA
ncbi:MAG: hypothetical protein ABIR67_15070, partial [Gaiellaceae bacterium]